MQWQKCYTSHSHRIVCDGHWITPTILVLCRVMFTTNDVTMNSSPLSAADSPREDSPTHQDL